MLILGIETSCDETSAAIVADGRGVLSNVVASQIDLHRKYGGIVPEIASRAHVESLIPVIAEAFDVAGVEVEQIDAVAVVNTPGLIGSLVLGVTAAKTLSWIWNRSLIAVDHIRCHIYAASLGRSELLFPCVSLVVSGGHTSLFHSRSVLEHSSLGVTIDDAAGEAFDKVATILSLSFPGGPAIEAAAKKGNPKAVRFKRPMLGADSLDFSFSGLKTAVLYHACGNPSTWPARRPGEIKQPPANLTEQQIADVAASFQECVVDVLVRKTFLAAEQCAVDRIVIGGGVAANGRLRDRLGLEAEKRQIEILFPKICHCTDNGAMVAGLAYHMLKAGEVASLNV
ncbi:MAG: tRNA (adenosine(37)-N6)-threonylcarbamoyltransferase complex transferase subunit TsaD, partial [Phycisphaerae bacterium]|nr:tRNA (adenosine(37)-N6)-threonylcarbamoyltransferase complex transferase subunit TsaD [Phycisphaerae bacterium]